MVSVVFGCILWYSGEPIGICRVLVSPLESAKLLYLYYIYVDLRKNVHTCYAHAYSSTSVQYLLYLHTTFFTDILVLQIF